MSGDNDTSTEAEETVLTDTTDTGVSDDSVAEGDTTTTDTTTDDKSTDDSKDDADKGKDGDSADDEGSQEPPENYADFVLPEGVEIDSDLLNEATPIFKELGLNQDKAQKLVDFQAKQIQAGLQAQVDAFKTQKEDWLNEAKADKDIGGDDFDENISHAISAIDKFGTPGLRQMLDDYGVGNHPEVIRFMVRVGKLTAEDVPGNNTSASTTEKDRVDRLYPNDRNG